tara:strand:+ start:579 stop:1037 length:459 start_codon:yes stop_codon:yes gene_type:complete
MEQESTPQEPIPQDPTTTGQEPYNSMSAEDKKRLVREELVRREQQRKDKLVDVVMRQTDYDREKSQIKLKEHNFDVEKIVREYMNPQKPIEPKEEIKLSTNQIVYKEFRTMLDQASTKYRIEKEVEEKRMKYLYALQQKKKEAAASLKNNIK